MTHNQGRLLNLLNDVCHCESLTRAGNSTESLVTVPRFDRFHQFGDRLFLIPHGSKFTDEAEIHTPRYGIFAACPILQKVQALKGECAR